MMKISTLLLIAFLISSTVLALTTTKVADDSSFATMSAITAISARLTTALNGLSLFAQPSLDGEEVFREAISTFFTFNRTVIDDFSDIDESHLTRILNELGGIENENFTVSDVLNHLDELERINGDLKDLPSLKDLFKDSIPSAFDNQFEKSDLSRLDKNFNLLVSYEKALPKNRYDNTTRPPSDSDKSHAAEALRELPAQIDEIIKIFSIDDLYSKVVTLLNLIKSRKEIYEGFARKGIESILSVNSKIFEEANSFRKATNVSKSLSSMCRKVISTNTFIDLSSLENDLDDPTFLSTLNEEESSEALKKILPPIVEISKKVKSYWSGIEEILRNQEFKSSSEKLERVLSLLIEAVPQKIDFQSSLKSIGELTNLVDFSIDATSYEEIETLTNLLATFKDELKRLSDSEEVKNMNVSDSVINQYDYKTDELSEAIERFKHISSSLDNLNDMREKIINELKDLKWRHIGKKIDEWMTIVFIPFATKMKEKSEVIKRLKSAVNFLQESKNLDLPNFHSQIVSLQKKMEEVREGIKEELETFQTKEEDEPYYKYMINLRIESSPLREQLMRASHIFGLLDHYLLNQNWFDDFIEQGTYLKDKFPNDEFTLMKDRMEELNNQIEIRKKRYEGKSMKELFEMRSFIDNLQNLPNPALRTNEWRTIAQNIGDRAAKFNKTIDAIFDLDFTLHQRNLIGTFSNYKGYVRFNMIIPKISDIQKRAFYDQNYGWIEFATFVGKALLANGLLYAGGLYLLRRDDKKEAEREKRIRRDYYRMFAPEFDKKRGFVGK
uniref:WSN domain-containing protein n=1 Tax=Caenorhabditis tropicalis TaxID=1561998 RepID=A0A1I7TDL8_9PELO